MEDEILIEFNRQEGEDVSVYEVNPDDLKKHGINAEELIRVSRSLRNLFAKTDVIGLAISGKNLGLWIERGECHITETEMKKGWYDTATTHENA